MDSSSTSRQPDPTKPADSRGGVYRPSELGLPLAFALLSGAVVTAAILGAWPPVNVFHALAPGLVAEAVVLLLCQLARPRSRTSWLGPAAILMAAAVVAILGARLAVGTFGAFMAGFAVAAALMLAYQLARPRSLREWIGPLAELVAGIATPVATMALSLRLDAFSAFMLASLALYASFVLAMWGMRRWFLGWLAGLGGLYLLLVVLLFAATAFEMRWHRFMGIVLQEHIRDAAILSFKSSIMTVVLAMIVGIPLGYLLSRRRFWGHTFIDTVLDIPIVLPPLVVGVALLIFFNTVPGRWINDAVIAIQHGINILIARVQKPFTNRPWQFAADGLVFAPEGVVIAQFVVAAAFGIRTLKATFDQIDPRIESVARTLGASRRQAFFRVTLPMAGHGILAAAVMTWARAIGEFGPILIFSGTTPKYTEVLPTAIYLEFQVGQLQSALAVSLMMVLLAMLTLWAFKKLGGRFAM
ncbi:MAG: hypothetical protein BIFFINMI_01796 [Phycisphaerae bacterium]|nr:hypothetical protein [Phycisphaerae bacterium]